jgi:hypothetical protein
MEPPRLCGTVPTVRSLRGQFPGAHGRLPLGHRRFGTRSVSRCAPLRAATTHRRKRQTRSFVKQADDIVNNAGDDRNSPERDADQRRQLVLLDRALSALDADKRAIFVMAELQGDSVVAIAEGLGIPVDTAYSRLRAARRIFREAAEALYGEQNQTLAERMQTVGT